LGLHIFSAFINSVALLQVKYRNAFPDELLFFRKQQVFEKNGIICVFTRSSVRFE